MSCGRARRQLLWLVQFGELDQESAPHLDHLAGCRACRDDVGIDRALVRRLRTALAERVADASPSPEAWEGILARMRQPEPRPAGLRGLATRFVSALRAGTAMAGAGLALILALNLEVMPLAPSPPDAPPTEAADRPAWAGGIPPFVDVAPPAASPAAADADAAAEVMVGVPSTTEVEQLLPGRSAAAQAIDEPATPEPADPDDGAVAENGWEVLAVRLVPSDAERIAASEAGADEGPAEEPDPALVPSAQGPS